MANFIPTANKSTLTSLADGEYAYIGKGIQVAGIAAAANNQIYIDGTVAGETDLISLGVNSFVDVGKTGVVWGDTSGIAATAGGSIIYNDGEIFGRTYGITHWLGLISEIHNSGTITGGTKGGGTFNAGIENRQASGDTYLENTGLIETQLKDSFSYRSSGSVNETILNDGTMIGKVALGGGADKFDTRDGILKGALDGGAGADTLYGSSKADTFDGGADNDKIYGYDGNDILSGGNGDDYISASNGKDKLTGGLGKDELRGGADADTFIFKLATDSTTSAPGRDLILDFSQTQKDKIDLSAIDAKASTGTDNSFSFIGKNGYTETEGQLRYKTENGVTKIYGDTNGDGTSEFAIWLDGVYTLKATDFIL